MNPRRYGESSAPLPYRSKRLYRADAHWYFDTREGTQFGPFRTKQGAKRALAVFLAQNVFGWTNEQLKAENHPGTQDGIEHMVEEVIEVLRCERDFGALAAENWIKSRLEDLDSKAKGNPTAADIADVLQHAMDYGSQLFEHDMFEPSGV